jgi:hypothetical protein
VSAGEGGYWRREGVEFLSIYSSRVWLAFAKASVGMDVGQRLLSVPTTHTAELIRDEKNM